MRTPGRANSRGPIGAAVARDAAGGPDRDDQAGSHIDVLPRPSPHGSPPADRHHDGLDPALRRAGHRYPGRMMLPPRSSIPQRVFDAADVLSGRAQLHGYPYTFLTVVTPASDNVNPASPLGAWAVAQTMAATEMLEAHGWRVVNFSANGLQSYLRRERRPMPPRPGEPVPPPPDPIP